MRQWDHGGGFSLNAAVRVEATDRKGLERLLRYLCPSHVRQRALEPWHRQASGCLFAPKARALGQTVLSLTPIAFLERVPTLIPPPRRHRHRYHGVLAPNAPLRAGLTARAPLPVTCALLLARIYESQAQGWACWARRGCKCSPSRARSSWRTDKIIAIAFITDRASIKRILDYLGEPASAPPISPARGPPRWEDFDPPEGADPVLSDTSPEYEFDQRVIW